MDNSNFVDKTLKCGCSIKVELEVVYKSIENIQNQLFEIGVKINQPTDADIFPKTENEITIERKYFNTYDFDKETNIDLFNSNRAIVMLSVMPKNANVDYISNTMLKFYKKKTNSSSRLFVGKGHTIKGAKSQNEEIILFDFIKESYGHQIGYTIANNDTIQIIDPNEKQSSSTQVYPALNNALNDLMLFGAIDNLRFFPVYDSPNEQITHEIGNTIKNYMDIFKFNLIDLKPLNKGSSLIGATVFGDTYKEPPIFYSQLKKGDNILVHRSFGDLAPLNAYLCSSFMINQGFTFAELKYAKEKIISLIKMHNFEIGKIINNYCPEFGEKLDRKKHILITKDISGEGLSIFKELAIKANKNIHITEIPLLFKDITFATVENFFITDGTSGINGAIAIIASDIVIEQVLIDLRKKGFEPNIIGYMGDEGSNKVYVPIVINKLINSNEILKNFEVA
ncbi:MAG: SelD-related putative sulfur metabolism protein [Candidatus Methanoperedens sp.]